jgi:hypothetical protein
VGGVRGLGWLSRAHDCVKVRRSEDIEGSLGYKKFKAEPPKASGPTIIRIV